METPAQLLTALFQAAIDAVDARRSVRAALENCAGGDPVEIVAIGKAAIGMMHGAIDALGGRINRGLVIAAGGGAEAGGLGDRFECHEGGHPLPTRASLDAGARLLEFLQESPRGAELLFLISGGASALVEAPVPGISLDDLVRLNRWLLASGLDIGAVNTVRKQISQIKGGGLLTRLGTRRATALYISDVAGDRITDIASGPLGPVESRPLPPLPEWAQSLLATADSPAPPKDDAGVERRIVARLADAMAGAAAAARERGFDTFMHEQRLEGEAEKTGARIAEELMKAQPGIHIWGGETVVHLPLNPGRGGRSQSLALSAAIRLAQSISPSPLPLPPGESQTSLPPLPSGEGGEQDNIQINSPITLLAAGTDGIDGPGDAAGAIVDAATIARGIAAGHDPKQALVQADAGTFLDATGSLLHTGPTGTNVTDIVIALKR